jgi:hypothetical protein
MKHSLFGPSSLERRSNCPGSFRLEKDLPPIENEYAKKGTELHEAVAKLIKDEAKGIASGLIMGIYSAAEQEAINFCYNQYKACFYEPMTNRFIQVEKEFDFTSILPMVEIGTTDLVIWEPYKTAHVFDWKFNFNPIPEAINNIQLGVYALGAFKEYEAQTVHVHLVEAFSKKVTDYRYDISEQKNIIDFVELTINNCMKAFAPLRPSKESCQYCRAQVNCPAILDKLFSCEIINPLTNLPASEVAKLLDIAELNLTVCGKIKEYAYSCMSAGSKIPGWILKEGRKSRFWKSVVTEQTLIEVGKAIGRPTDALVHTELLSPPELEKLWGKNAVVTSQLKEFIDFKIGNPILTKEKI